MEALPESLKCNVTRDQAYSTTTTRSSGECKTACENQELCNFVSYGSAEQSCRMYTTEFSCTDPIARTGGPVFFRRVADVAETNYSSVANTKCTNAPTKTQAGTSTQDCVDICNSDPKCRYTQYDATLNQCTTYKECTEEKDTSKRFTLQKLSDLSYLSKLRSANKLAQSALEVSTAGLTELASQLELKSNSLVQLSSDIAVLTAKLQGRTGVDEDLATLQADINTMETNLAAAQALNQTRADLIRQKEAIIASTTLTLEQKKTALEQTLLLIEENSAKLETSVASIATSQAKIEEQKAKLETVEAELKETKESVGIVPAIMDFLDSIADAFGIEL